MFVLVHICPTGGLHVYDMYSFLDGLFLKKAISKEFYAKQVLTTLFQKNYFKRYFERILNNICFHNSFRKGFFKKKEKLVRINIYKMSFVTM